MKRQFVIFLVVFLVIVALGLGYGSQVVADLTVFYPTSVDTSGTKIILAPDDATPFSSTQRQEYQLVAQDTQRVVARRLDQLNLKGYYSLVVHNNQLEVTLPKHENTPYIVSIITRVGEVEFIDGGTESPPIGQQVTTAANMVSAKDKVYQILFSGKEITSVIPPDSSAGTVFYQIRLQPAAAERLTQFLGAGKNAYVCLVIDKQVINCSRLYHWSDNTLDILPNLSGGTDISLADLAIFLDSGPLPMSLGVVTN